jgi:hypothetical protein
MLSRGDSYYAQLLLNTPEAGILDLGDMEKTSALEWVSSLRDLLFGINPLKIPVLYEHTTKAEFIPFGRPPSEIMYDGITLKYAAIVCAGYGLTLADIGLAGSGGAGAGGDTLAGTIRSERTSKSSGLSTAKKKLASYLNRILPDSIEFRWIDYDDEKNVAKGRARLATAQAADVLIRNKTFLPSEIRQQMLADGLISITVPETIDPNNPEFVSIQPALGKPNFGGSRPQQLGNPKAPSSGGQGEVIPQQVVQRSMNSAKTSLTKAVFNANLVLSVLLQTVRKNLSQEEIELWDEYVDDYLVGRSQIEEEKLAQTLNDICLKVSSVVEAQTWCKEFSDTITEKILQDASNEEVSKRLYENETQEPEQVEEVVKSELETKRGELERFTSGKLVDELAKYAVIISKSKLLNGELDVDSTESTSENIRVSREVAEEILENLSTIVKTVKETGKQYLDTGELDARD